MSGVPEAVERVRSLWYDGDAWCRVGWFDDLAPPTPPWSRAQRRLRDAVVAWRSSFDEAAGHAIVQELVDAVLCAELPESSAFAELEQGPWVACPPSEALAVAEQLQSRLGCDVSAEALEWFRTVCAGALGAWRCDHPDATGVVVLDAHLGAFFLDRG
ncbi:MAG: hypothetical protein R3F61_10190 [Myxococcota bacterium]